MAASILTTANRSNWKTQARIKLVGEDSAVLLPDATVEAFVDQAERAIKGKVTDWASLTGDNKENLIDAALSYLCALLVPAIRNIMARTEKVGETSITRDLDFNKLEADLYGESGAFCQAISTYSCMPAHGADVISPTTPMFEEFK
ncbi:MAG: hypothetical protein A4E60_00239 [Syntrophorhabdus sp. PtaB.Bin047]|jgi:hypothetical protein|nr:MAG: hypothetical protein A4E60_00239 [Syntrophorhabdus sp. PtaB.Bin047]